MKINSTIDTSTSPLQRNKEKQIENCHTHTNTHTYTHALPPLHFSCVKLIEIGGQQVRGVGGSRGAH